MRRVLLIMLAILMLSLSAYGNEVFDVIYSSLINKATHLQQRELEKKYGGKTISGTGYVYDVIVNTKDDKLVIVKMGLESWYPNYVIIYINKRFLSVAKKLQKNQKIGFSGYFKGISSGNIIIGNKKSKIYPE